MTPAKLPKLHFLIQHSGEPVLLPSDRQFYIGRAEGNNIVIDDLRASRRHAEILYDGSDFVITDLQSSNGTFVNGEQITSQPLRNGDVIEIGIHQFTYRELDNIGELNEARQQVAAESRASETAQMPMLNTGTFSPDSDFTGTLATLGMGDLIQLLNLSRRSGLLLVKASQGRAMLYFDEGEVVQAEYGTLIGDEAIRQIVGEREGHFSFRGGQRALEKNVQGRVSHLLLEAARLRDEENRSS
jgi:hypothetical protein